MSTGRGSNPFDYIIFERKKRRKMEKKLRVVLIGAGAIAKFHLNGILAKKECELYGLCDSASDDRLQKKQEEFQIPHVTKDYRDFVNDPEVDIAIVATPDYSHMEITCAFLRAGKHVLLEKPMALRLEECEEMRRVEKESGKRLMVGQVCRYNNNFVQAKKLLDEGKIGDLVFVESEYAHSYAKSRGYDDWRVNPEREGVIGGGCHAIDLLRWIAGDPTEVQAYSNHKYLTDWPVNDSTIAIYKFPNNVIGKVFCSIGVNRDYTMRTCIYGTEGTLIFDSRTTEMYLYQSKNINPDGPGFAKAQVLPCDPMGHNMTAEISDFVDAILSDRPNPISSLEGASTVAVCRATVEAAKKGASVQIVYPEA